MKEETLYSKIPELFSTKSTLVDIINRTKKFVRSRENYSSFLKSSYDLSKQSNTMHQVLPTYTLPATKTINTCYDVVKTEETNDSDYLFRTRVNLAHTTRYKHKLVKLQKTFYPDIFLDNFLDYIGREDNTTYNYITPSMSFEEYCFMNIGGLKQSLRKQMLLETTFNEGNYEEVKLSLKSFALEIVNTTNKKAKKFYLPFDFVVIFAFCKFEEIVFILSQSIEMEEESLELKFNEKRLLSVISYLHIFNTSQPHDLKNKFKINKNLKFQWVTDTTIYNCNLRCPVICFNFLNRKIIINKHLEVDLFVHIFSDNCEKWDTYVINHLTSDKEFRLHFNKVICKNNPYNAQKNKLNLTIDKRFRSPNTGIYDPDEPHIPIIYTNKEGTNCVILLHGYSIVLRNKITNTAHNLSWKYTLVLLNIKEHLNLDDCINRKCKVDNSNDNILFDSSWIDELNEEVLMFYTKHNVMRTAKDYKLIEPRISIQNFINNRGAKQKLNIPMQYLNEIASLGDVHSMINYLASNIDKVLAFPIVDDCKEFF
jgi:hypothetical protein